MGTEGYEVSWTPVLEHLVSQVLDTPLAPVGVQLRHLGMADKMVEMEFMLPISQLNCGALNRLIAEHDPLSARAGQLSFEQVNGMLKGFIDLVFRHEGRYYVLDYKSNHLGHALEDYTQAAMAEAMIDHRYDLQYQLYTLALHRLLQSRIPDYDYETHMGGVFYLFMRGIGHMERGQVDVSQNTDTSGQTGVFFQRPTEMFINALDQLLRGEEVTP